MAPLASRLVFLALVCMIVFSGCGGDSGGPAGPSDPACKVDDESLSFGSVTLGQSSDLTFTIENTGGGTLSGTVSETCAEFSIVGTATYSLGAGQTATFTVRFSPTSAGSKACTIETGSTECADVSCSGTGVSVPACQVTPTSLPFGSVTVGESSDLTFTIENTGGGTLSGTVSETCAEFSIVGTATYSLGAGQTATFTIRFAPTSEGAKACTIETGSSECNDVSCTGTGTILPACQVSTASLSFGSVTVGATSDLTFTIQNTGGGTLSGTVTETCAEFSIVGTATYSLGAGQTATFTVRFSPTSAGSKACTTETGSTECADVSCSGTGVSAPAYFGVGFDGIDDYAIVSSPSFSINSMSEVTVEGWIYRTKAGSQLILDKRFTGSDGYALGIDVLGKLYFTFSGNTVTSSASLPLGQWTFVTGQYDMYSDRLEVYINGFLEGFLSIDISFPSSSYGPLYIARDHYGIYYFGGVIDELAVYNSSTRSGSFSPPFHLPLTFARALWYLDEGVGSTLYDSSIGGNNATLYGGIWISTGKSPMQVRQLRTE